MILYFDGGCKPNPGEMEICAVVDGEAFHERNLGFGTNNQAEWASLLFALTLAKARGAKDITVLGDSMLVVNQATGQWRCKQPELQVMLDEYKTLTKNFDSVDIRHVRREHNLAGHVIEG